MATYPEKSCPTCGTKHSRMFPHCATHERRLSRTGSPTGRMVTRQELNYWRPTARALLAKYEHEPAIVAAHRVMDVLLHTFGSDMEHAAPGRRLRPHLDALLDAGVTARSSLIELLALAMYWQIDDRNPTAAEMDMIITRRLLNQKYGTGPRSELRRKVAASLGYTIRTELFGVLFSVCAFWKKSVELHAEQRKVLMSFNPEF